MLVMHSTEWTKRSALAVAMLASCSDPALAGERIFADGFDGPKPMPNALLVAHDVPIDDMLGDRFAWLDGLGNPREAVLAHNDGAIGVGGTHGGELREFRYQTGQGTRIVRAPATGAGGFGYVVSHRSEGTGGIGADDSPLGHRFSGQFERVFEGRHHVIFRFTMLYPRYSRTDANPPNTRYDVPVTIQWQFASGQDNPLWSVSWDLSGVPVDALRDDSRAPYGELLFDGSADAASHDLIGGVGWGDRYKFTSETSPLSYNSSWDWSVVNSIPYVNLWTAAADATMGIVATQTIIHKDAGGVWGVDRWGTSSADGDACGPPIGPASVMPCDFNWPYQSVNYSLNPYAPNAPTNNTRLAWGTNFGFLGQLAYRIHGSAWYGGPLPDTFAAGWPRQSYSSYIVFGLHSKEAVAKQVAQVEVMQTVTLSASLGGVAVLGPAGAGRNDTMSYLPEGYDPLHGALVFHADQNRLDANITIGSGVLHHPLIVLRDYHDGYPFAVRLDGNLLVPGVDCYSSLRADAGELWITLNRDLAGAINHLEVIP